MKQLTKERHEEITTALGLLSAVIKLGGEVTFDVADMAVAGYEYSLEAKREDNLWTFKAVKKTLYSSAP